MVVNEITFNLNVVLNDILPDVKNEALDKAGTLVQNEAKKRVGVDTGVLRNSIGHVTDENSVTIGSGIEYAPFHHMHNKFLQNAIDENISGIKKCFDNML